MNINMIRSSLHIDNHQYDITLQQEVTMHVYSYFGITRIDGLLYKVYKCACGEVRYVSYIKCSL